MADGGHREAGTSTQSSDLLPAIEFWFEFGSSYSYLSVMRIEDSARQRRVRVVWRPFALEAIFRVLGMGGSPLILQKEKANYVWCDVARQCRKYGLPWAKPTKFPRASALSLRVALLGADEPWIGDFCRRVMELNFVQDRDFDRVDRLFPILSGLGLPAADILDRAQSDLAKNLLIGQTAQARLRGIFGAPTFFVGAEMFWGNDRLDDALSCAAEQQR